MQKKQKRFLIVSIFLIGFSFLWSQSGIAQWYVASSDLARRERDYPRALKQLNRAVSLASNNPNLLASRGHLRLEMIIAKKNSDFSTCIADFTQAIELATKHKARQFRSLRAGAYQHWAVRCEDGQERRTKFQFAIDDLQTVLDELSIPSHSKSLERASALNGISYTRGLANVDIEQALIDIELALEILEYCRLTNRISVADARDRRSAYLDTRGYLRFRAKRYEEAKEDMEEAIRSIELQSESVFGLFKRLTDSLSVMYFHRGKIYEALQYQNLADADLKLADNLGYPENGSL